MTIRALAVTEPVPHRSRSASQTCCAVTGLAAELRVGSFERIVREPLVVERLDLEGLGDVTDIACSLGRGETKLPSMRVSVTPATLTWRSAIRRPFAAPAIFARRAVTAVAGGLRMCARQRPCAVVDSR
jgi:hypothetical protein